MLDDIAIQFVNQSESDLRIMGYALAILGGIIAGIVNKSKVELARTPYFAYSALIFLLVSAVQIIWLGSISAMSGGYLWVLMVVNIVASVIAGFFVGKIAIARSRDAYGHGRMAALAFIPVANFWLLLTASKNPLSANRAPTIPLLTGGLGVLSGFAMLIATVAGTVFMKQEADRIAKREAAKPTSQRVGIEFMLKSHSLEKTLRLIATIPQTPIKIDEVTTLARIEADGIQLHRTYVVALDLATISDQFRVRILKAICSHSPFIPLLRAGARIREVYIKTDGSPIGAVLVTRDVCELGL